MTSTVKTKSRGSSPKSVGRSNWFEHFFHGVALDCWRKCLSPEQTKAEADFLERMLGTKICVLDVPCGNGRHSIELARRGCRITGVDLSNEFVAEATASAKAAGLDATFYLRDMRRLSFDKEFDGAFCMGNSFGYFEYPDMVQFVARFARSLKPGGRFVIDTGCAAESILPTLKQSETYQLADISFTIENRYDSENSCLETEGTFLQNGKMERRTFWHWVYTVGEIRRLLGNAGLEVKQLYSSLNAQQFRLGNPVLYVFGQKRGVRRSR